MQVNKIICLTWIDYVTRTFYFGVLLNNTGELVMRENTIKAVRVCMLVMSLGCGMALAAGDKHGHKQHHDFPMEVMQFHQVMATLWHAAPGSDRVTNICAQASTLKQRAEGVWSAATPERARSQQTAWRDAAQELRHSVDSMQSACDRPDRLEVEPALAGVHNAFHSLVRFLGHHH